MSQKLKPAETEIKTEVKVEATNCIHCGLLHPGESVKSTDPITLLTKKSLMVYTKGGNKVYTFLKDARTYVRKRAKAPKQEKSAETLNTAFDSILAEG